MSQSDRNLCTVKKSIFIHFLIWHNLNGVVDAVESHCENTSNWGNIELRVHGLCVLTA